MMMEPKGPGGHSTRGSHRLAQVGTCYRKWFLRWVRALKPNKSPIYFLEGTLAHIALAYYRANQLHQLGRAVPKWFYEESMQDCLLRNGEGFPDAVALGNSIFQAYHARYSPVGLDAWDPIAIEEEYTATLGQIRQLITPGCAPRPDDHEVFTSRIDLMLRVNGWLWACDYKTTKGYRGKLGEFKYDGEFAVNWQFLLQTAILKVNFGTEFRGVIVERVLKATPHEFQRTPAPLSVAMFRSLPGTLSKLAWMERHVAQQALDAQAAGEDMGAWLPAEESPWACFSWGQPCEYRLICTADGAGQLKSTVVGDYHSA